MVFEGFSRVFFTVLGFLCIFREPFEGVRRF
jgi:hypothetical protein